MINSYPSIYNLGHSAISDLLKGSVIVEEKIDGSQFGFGLDAEGHIQCRSKGAQINILAPEGMFAEAVKTVEELAPLLRPGVVFRGEYLKSPKHNALCYSRIPAKHIILFDITTGLETYMTPEEKQAIASYLGLECVPELFRGIVEDANHFRTLLDRESCLGGQKIEGVVIKPLNYDQFGKDKKCLMGKFVSEAFREVHWAAWDAEHKTKSSNDIIEILAAKFGTNARWNKALIHLKEAGSIENTPRDIGLLMKEVPEDIFKECATMIADDLMDWAWPQLRRRVTRGVPEWYKEELQKRQFETPEKINETLGLVPAGTV
jgi:hypothetical protein